MFPLALFYLGLICQLLIRTQLEFEYNAQPCRIAAGFLSGKHTTTLRLGARCFECGQQGYMLVGFESGTRKMRVSSLPS